MKKGKIENFLWQVIILVLILIWLILIIMWAVTARADIVATFTLGEDPDRFYLEMDGEPLKDKSGKLCEVAGSEREIICDAQCGYAVRDFVIVSVAGDQISKSEIKAARKTLGAAGWVELTCD